MQMMLVIYQKIVHFAPFNSKFNSNSGSNSGDSAEVNIENVDSSSHHVLNNDGIGTGNKIVDCFQIGFGTLLLLFIGLVVIIIVCVKKCNCNWNQRKKHRDMEKICMEESPEHVEDMIEDDRILTEMATIKENEEE